MKSTPFDPTRHYAPIPFSENICHLAGTLKSAGLDWTPHPGCFVWDPEEAIKVSSPFPHRIYFILNLNHFIRILGSEEEVRRRLVWLPTWNQAMRLAEALGGADTDFGKLPAEDASPESQFEALYRHILKRLHER